MSCINQNKTHHSHNVFGDDDDVARCRWRVDPAGEDEVIPSSERRTYEVASLLNLLLLHGN